MPTGYTSKIADGEQVSASEFIMSCARAFGALAIMRDEPLDAPTPEQFKADSYHLRRLEESYKELERFSNMSLEEAQELLNEEHERILKTNQEMIEKKNLQKQRYLNMIEQVEKWQVPSQDHINLKEFCLQQLNDSMDFDCNTEYYEQEVVKLSPEKWLEQQVEMCVKDIEYHNKHHDDETQRTNERNLWIKQLRNSLRDLEKERYIE